MALKQNLSRLREVTKRSHILEQVSFTVGDWRSKRNEIINEIIRSFGKTQIIVRSSTKNETFKSANAGFYDSVSNVTPDIPSITDSVENVIKSFGEGPIDNQVLVQRMIQMLPPLEFYFLELLTRVHPIMFEIDASSGKTDTVTAGNARNSKTIKILKSHRFASDIPSSLKILFSSRGTRTTSWN